ncbi:MAG: hypothetical protein K1X64_13845 [Myxococcaceae bacterium]|nr:hypothetical protein [Myxococcaceae bacterium]
MVRAAFRSVCASLVLFGLSACGPRELDVRVNVVTTACEADVNPWTGVNFVRVRVTGEGISKPLDKVVQIGAGRSNALEIPSIPAGAQRVVEVRGYSDDPTQGGRVISIGKSAAFDVPDIFPDDKRPEPLGLNVFVRKTDAFSPVNSANDPHTCTRMGVARAGHTATVMPDGKVFIAGGFQFTTDVLPKRKALADVEIFDPGTGLFAQGPRLSIVTESTRIDSPVAFHTATLTPDVNQIVLWGGEQYSLTSQNNVILPRAVALVYDLGTRDYGTLVGSQVARSHHSAVLDDQGRVVVVGGYKMVNQQITPVGEVETFHPKAGKRALVDGVSIPRMDVSVTKVQGLNQSLIAIAGGSDGSQLQDEVVFLKDIGGTYQKEVTAMPTVLRTKRRAAAAATLRDGRDWLLVGGHSTADTSQVSALASSEFISVPEGRVNEGPAVGSRGDACVAQLPNNRLIVIGGRTTDGVGSPSHSVDSTTLIGLDEAGGVSPVGGPPLKVDRWAHTCVTMKDGSVLVLGGIRESAGQQTILQDAWVYTPAPLD